MSKLQWVLLVAAVLLVSAIPPVGAVVGWVASQPLVLLLAAVAVWRGRKAGA